MRNTWTIARREFRHYFVSPIAYAVGDLPVRGLGILFYANVSFGMATGRIPSRRASCVAADGDPVVVDDAIPDDAPDRRGDQFGNHRLLLTAHSTGSWSWASGAIGFIGLMPAISWVYPIVLHRLTTPGIDQGVLMVAYLGLLLMMSSIVAIGVMVSAFFRNSLAAGFATLALILILWVIGGLASGAGGANEIVRYLSFGDHLFDHMFQGVLDLSDVLYYASLTVLALFVASQVVESRRWR
jgi:ABC-2 type transport system permease protein